MTEGTNKPGCRTCHGRGTIANLAAGGVVRDLCPACKGMTVLNSDELTAQDRARLLYGLRIRAGVDQMVAAQFLGIASHMLADMEFGHRSIPRDVWHKVVVDEAYRHLTAVQS